MYVILGLANLMQEYRIVQQSQGTFFCSEYFYFQYFKYILLIILTYFHLSKTLNARLLLVTEYFYSVVLVLLLE